MAVNESDRLGCGVTIDQVWDDYDHPDAHQRSCEFCQAARRDLAPVVAATSRWHDDDEISDDLHPSAELVRRVLAVARAEVRRGRRLPLNEPGTSDRGDGLAVSEQAVIAVARRAALAVPGVQVRRCEVAWEGDGHDAGSVDGDGVPGRVVTRVRISVEAGVSIPAAADELRRLMERSVRDEVGLDVRRIDIEVEDVHDA